MQCLHYFRLLVFYLFHIWYYSYHSRRWGRSYKPLDIFLQKVQLYGHHRLYHYNIRYRFRGTWNSLTLLPKIPGVIVCNGFSHPAPFKMGLVVMGPAYEIVVLGTSLSHNLSQDSACIDPYCMPQQRLFLVWGYDVIKVRLQRLEGKKHGENRSPCRQTARDKFITVTRYIWSMSIVNTKIIVTFNIRNR